jgi:hypothetical protein
VGKILKIASMNRIRSSLLEFPFFLSSHHKMGMATPSWTMPTVRMLAAMLAQLPGSPVKTQHPRLGELQPTHDNFRNFRIIKLEVAEKAL